MECPYEPSLPEYLDKELPVTHHREVAAHLFKCAGCRDVLADLELVSRALRCWECPEPPPMWNARELLRIGCTRRGRLVTWPGPLAACLAMMLAVPTADAPLALRGQIPDMQVAEHTAAHVAIPARTHTLRRVLAPRTAHGKRPNRNAAVPQHVWRAAVVVLDTARPEHAEAAITSAVAEARGSVAVRQQSETEQGGRNLTLALKVPVSTFDTTLSKVSRGGTVRTRTTSEVGISATDADAKVMEDAKTASILVVLAEPPAADGL